MRKLFSIFAALLVAVAVFASKTEITPTHWAGGDVADRSLYRALSQMETPVDTIVLADGTYTESQALPISQPVVIMAAEKAKPVLQCSGYVNLQATAKVIGLKFEFVGSSGNGYGFYINGDASKTLELEGCEMSGYTKPCICLENGAYHIDAITVNNCYFHDCTSYAIQLKAPSATLGSCDVLTITNSTFANFAGAAHPLISIDTKNNATTDAVEMTINHCTFYNFTKTSNDTYGIIDSRKATNVLVSNCIFANPETLPEGRYAAKATQLYGGTVSNCLRSNVPNHRTDAITLISDMNGDPKFADAENGDYTLDEESSPAKGTGVAGTHLGDPRWWPASWKPAEIIDVASVALDAAELAIDVHEIAFLHATVLPDNATDPSVTWTSSNKAVATVAGGVVKGIAAGTVTITAKAGEKTATCEVTVSDAIPSTDFAEPYFLKGTKAELEGNIFITEADSLHWENKSTSGTAIWKINALAGRVLEVTANYKVGSTTGSKLQVVILDADENQVGDTLNQGWHETDGDVVIPGSITLPAAGVYTVKLLNAQPWSSSKLRGITLKDVTPQRLYLKPAFWYWEGNQEKFAIWDITHSEWTAFMTLAEDETDIWTVTVPYNTTQVIFARFENSAPTPDWDGGHLWNKTYDLTLEEGKDMYTITAYGENYGPCFGEWSKYTHVEKPKFHISGSLTDWASVASYADSYEFDLEAGCYSLKVITLESEYLGYADLTEEYKAVELYPDEDGNACFTLETAGKVTVTYIKDNVFKLEGDFVLPPVRLPGITDWENYPTLTPAGNKLTASATVTLAWNYGYTFKVICGGTWLGKAKNGVDNYEVTRDAATLNGLSYKGDDMILRADKAGEYTFTWTYATRELVITYPDLVLEEGFYLVGTFDNEEEWDVASLNAGKKFAFNKEIGEGNNEWKITVPLHTGDRFKAVYIYGDNIASWHPEGSGNDYVVDANHAGASKTIYFQEEYNAEWDGYFYIEQNWPTAIDNSDAEIKVEKFFRDGQLIIRKNGVEYNAQGAIVK